MDQIQQEKTYSGLYLAANLKHLRKRQGLSQEELAQQVGLNRGNIASYESGSAEPRISKLLTMAEYFGISLIDLAQTDLTQGQKPSSLVRLHGLCPQERAKLEDLYKDAINFDDFLQGIHTCFNYEIKQLDTNEDLKRENQFMRSQFEQLYAAARQLSEKHLQLLRMCHTKD